MQQFFTIYKLKLWNLTLLFSITFPQEFWKSKKSGHLTSRSGDKKTVKRNEKHQYQKKSCSLTENLPKTFFLCAEASEYIHCIFHKVLSSWHLEMPGWHLWSWGLTLLAYYLSMITIFYLKFKKKKWGSLKYFLSMLHTWAEIIFERKHSQKPN